MTDENKEQEQIEPGSLDKTPDPYADFNEVQLRSTLKAKNKEIERATQRIMEIQREYGADIDHYKAKIGELETSLNEQLKTIQQQSETLNAREEIVNDLQAQVAVMQDAAQAQDIGGNPNAVLPEDVGDMLLEELLYAIQGYGLRAAAGAQDTQTALTAVHIIQLAHQLKNFPTWHGAIHWLNTGNTNP